jgi:hypothetical protein
MDALGNQLKSGNYISDLARELYETGILPILDTNLEGTMFVAEKAWQERITYKNSSKKVNFVERRKPKNNLTIVLNSKNSLAWGLVGGFVVGILFILLIV